MYFHTSAPGDYQSVDEELVFTMDSNATMCVDIIIEDDNIEESLETFFVSIDTTIAIDGLRRTTIAINDNDGKYCRLLYIHMPINNGSTLMYCLH